MRIDYWTTDFVNLNLARQWAEECGASLEQILPKDHPAENGCDAVLYDLDYLPADIQQEILARLTNGRLDQAAAVHSYNLEDALVAALQARGVVVERRLHKRLVERLRQTRLAVQTLSAAEPSRERNLKERQRAEAPALAG